MSQSPPTVTSAGRYTAVAVAFLGWMCAGVQMGTLPIASLSISQDLMGEVFSPALAAKWFGYFTAALSLGAACGGIFLGWLGDRIGRARAMAVSILCYTSFAGAGLGYNFWPFLVAGAVLAAGALTHFFGGDYAKAGALMGLIYALGMIAIWFTPDTTGKKLADGSRLLATDRHRWNTDREEKGPSRKQEGRKGMLPPTTLARLPAFLPS